jgi:hypothetical protein
MPKIVERIFFIANIALKFHDDIPGGRNANMVHPQFEFDLRVWLYDDPSKTRA